MSDDPGFCSLGKLPARGQAAQTSKEAPAAATAVSTQAGAPALDGPLVSVADPRIRAVVAMAPMAVVFTPDSLKAIGVRVEESEDGLTIEGTSGDLLPGGATVAGHLDHRICMSFAIAGLVSKAPVTIDDMAPVATSFPNFEALLAGLQQ